MAATFATKPLIASKSFTLKHALRPVVSLNIAVAKNKYHPLYEKALERLKDEERPLLIIDVIATIKRTSPKAVVRNRSKHRIREATHQVLKENGYGTDGKAGDGKKEDLVGTLAFFTTAESVLTPWEELKEEVRNGVVKWLALRQKCSKPARKPSREEAKPGPRDGTVGRWHATYGGVSGPAYGGGNEPATYRRARETGLETGAWGYKRGVREGVGERVGESPRRANRNTGAGSREYLRGAKWESGGGKREGREGGIPGGAARTKERGGGGEGRSARTCPDHPNRGPDPVGGGGAVRTGRGDDEGRGAKKYTYHPDRNLNRTGGGGVGGAIRIRTGGEGRGGGDEGLDATKFAYHPDKNLSRVGGGGGGVGGVGRGAIRTVEGRGGGDESRDARKYPYHPDRNLDHEGGRGGSGYSGAGEPVGSTSYVKLRPKGSMRRRF